MKRITVLLMTLLLVLLTGCGKSEYEVNEEQLGIILQPDIKEDYYRLIMEYSLSETALGSKIVESTDGNPIKEENIFFTIDKENFPEGIVNLKNFSFRVIVSLDENISQDSELTTENSLLSYASESFEAEFGKIYIFTLRENSEGVLELIRE